VAASGAATSGFKTTSVAAPASKPVAICFENQDSGVSHNIGVFSDDPIKDPSAKTFFTGDIVSGPTTTDYAVGKLAPGSYFFHCDVHPTTMTGTLTVK
jgi:plastocyanin